MTVNDTLQLVLLRHGETVFNAEGRMQGHIDTALSDRGRQQARAVAKVLAQRPMSRIYSSDLSRALDTAMALGEASGCEVIPDVRLRETHLGVWQGETKADIDASYPGARARWREDPTWAPDGAETQREVAARAFGFLTEVIADPTLWDGRVVVLVAHGGLHAALATTLLDFHPTQVAGLGRLGNACFAEFTANQYSVTDDGIPRSLTALGATGSTPQVQLRWVLNSWNRSA